MSRLVSLSKSEKPLAAPVAALVASPTATGLAVTIRGDWVDDGVVSGGCGLCSEDGGSTDLPSGGCSTSWSCIVDGGCCGRRMNKAG